MATTAVTSTPAAATTGSGRVPRARNRGRSRSRGWITAYLFILPGFALFALVMLYPTVRAFSISLHDWKIIPGVKSPFVGLANYRRALHDPTFLRSLVNASVYMLITVPGQILLGLLAAVLLDAKLPGRTAFRLLFYLPVVTSWVVVSLLFRFLFASDGGVANWILHDQLHVVSGNVEWLQHRWTALLAICLLGIWKGIGWSMVIFLAALTGVSKELHEAAAIDGAGAWLRFRHVSLPAIRRTLVAVTVLLVIGAFNVFISVLLMTNGGPQDGTQVPLTYMYRQAFNFLDFGYGSALAFLLTALVFAISAGQYWLGTRKDPEGVQR